VSPSASFPLLLLVLVLDELAACEDDALDPVELLACDDPLELEELAALEDALLAPAPLPCDELATLPPEV
jgi:hypothetical protein